MRVGVIGLGTGTIAAYGRAGDIYRFYDIDPQRGDASRAASSPTSATARRKVEMALGDARLTLEREAPQNFDVLAVDAFSSDAIPVHLITREALGVYLRHMKPDGIVAFHVSNRFLDLGSGGGAHRQGERRARGLVRDDPDDDEDSRARGATGCWCRAMPRRSSARRSSRPAPSRPKDHPEWRTWTDDYSEPGADPEVTRSPRARPVSDDGAFVLVAPLALLRRGEPLALDAQPDEQRARHQHRGVDAEAGCRW